MSRTSPNAISTAEGALLIPPTEGAVLVPATEGAVLVPATEGGVAVPVGADISRWRMRAAVPAVLPHARLGSGVLLTGLALVVAGAATHSSLLVAPFAATAALGHAAPHSPLARPRNVIGGYVVGALVGLAVGLVAGPSGVAMAAAAALAAVAMLALEVEHPPAVAMAVVALQAPSPWALQVAAVGAITITLATAVLVPALHRRPYPLRTTADRVGRTGS